MKRIKIYFRHARSIFRLLAAQLSAQTPIMLLVAAAWFGLVALALPWLLRLLLLVSPLLSGLFAVWALVHLLFGVGKLAIGLRRARQ